MKNKNRSGKRHMDYYDDSERNAVTSESLDEYIRVSKPGTVIVIGAMLFVLAAVIVWGFAGKLPVTETLYGLVVDVKAVREKQKEGLDYNINYDIKLEGLDENGVYIICFVEASRFNLEQVSSFLEDAVLRMPDMTDYRGKIKKTIGVPLSWEQCKNILFGNEWVTQKCVLTDYSWCIVIEPDTDISDYAFMLSEVTLLTDEVAPITFLTGKAQ